MTARPFPTRLPFMALAALALLAALWAGLVRLGWQLPPLPVPLAIEHGPLMVSGFLGTLISLERAVALGPRGRLYRLAYLAPALLGLGGIALVLSLPPLVARGLSAAGALGLVAIFALILRLQTDRAHLTMSLGAQALLIGNLLWLAGQPTAWAVPWWAAFLVLTIAGERLELSRVLRPGPCAQAGFVLVIGLYLMGLLLALSVPDAGLRLSGLGLLLLALWLLRFDLARRTLRQAGLTRFIAACLLLGYGWLALHGSLWLALGSQFTSGQLYDALLHSLFLGFVMSMVFGHAPVILPALLGVAIPFRSYFYAHLALLHASLAVRVAADLLGLAALRQWGGLFNEIALLLFLLSSVRAARSHRREPVVATP